MAIQFAAAAVLVVVLLFGGANAQFNFGDADTGNGIIVDSEGIEGDVLSVPAVILPAPPLPSVLVPSNVSPLVPRRPYTCSCGAFYFSFFC